MKRILSVLVLAFCSTAGADVLSVFIWEAPVGHGAEMFQNGMKAKAMHEAMGGKVFVGSGQDFRMYYSVRTKDSAARGKFVDQLATSEEWQAFMTQASQREGASKLVQIYNMEVVMGTEAEGGPATMAFQWQPNPGATATVLANSAAAKAIHEKLGAAVEVMLDEVGLVHYVLRFKNWETQGQFQDALNVNKEWQEWWAGVTANPSAKLLDVIRITRIGG